MLGAVGVHASALGICYPRLERIAAVAHRGRTWAFTTMRELRRMGYVRLLQSGSKRRRHANRYQVLWTKGAPVPRGEHAELDPTLRAGPWMFNQPIQQEVAEMIRTATKEIEEPIAQNELARRNHEAATRDRELLQGATRVSRHFADSLGRAAGVAPQQSFSFLTARKWLVRGFSEKECCQHIDAHGRDER